MSRRNSNKSQQPSGSPSLLGLPPVSGTKATTGKTTTPTATTSNGDEPDPDLLVGYQFGQQYSDKTPLDYIGDEDGVRPGSYMKKPPSGYTTVDMTQGLRSWQVIPPLAIWKRGKWWDQLTPETQDAIHVNAIDEREAWVVSGEGTPGDYLLRVYIVPTKVADQQDPKHPFDWTKKQREEGDGKKVTGTGLNWTGYQGQGSQQSKPPTPPKPPPLPSGIVMRCLGCGHFFDGETKLAGHSTHCCPGSANWGPEGADWVLPCKCCGTWDETAVCKPGYPRAKPKPAEKEEAVEPVPSGA